MLIDRFQAYIVKDDMWKGTATPVVKIICLHNDVCLELYKHRGLIGGFGLPNLGRNNRVSHLQIMKGEVEVVHSSNLNHCGNCGLLPLGFIH